MMSLSILCSIAQKLHSADAFTIMADECTDISNHEQLVICFRLVDIDIEVHEEFVGLYQIADISADTIVQALKDCLVQMNLQWNRCRGQCYDSAANMAGHRRGIVAQILSVEPRALFMHCYGHSLNLAMCNTKNCKLTRNAMHGGCCSWLYREGLVSAGWPVLLLSCTTLGDNAWWLLQLAIEKDWSALDGPFFIQTSVENGCFTLGGLYFWLFRQ